MLICSHNFLITQGLEGGGGGFLIPHSRSFLTRISSPYLRILLSPFRFPFFFPINTLKRQMFCIKGNECKTQLGIFSDAYAHCMT